MIIGKCPVCGADMRVGTDMTNADRIREMTDEELAGFLTVVSKKSAEKLCEALEIVDVDISNCDFELLTRTHLDWLRQEAEEGG